MSLLVTAQVTAVATAVLALFAIITAIYAIRAFRAQSREVSAIEQQVTDQNGVLKLQEKELRESLDERKREREDRKRAQASKVAGWFTRDAQQLGDAAVLRPWGAVIRNDSDLPVLGVRVSFYYIQEEPGGYWQPILRCTTQERVLLIPPHHDKFVEMPRELARMANEIRQDLYLVSIEFTDAAGNRWERDPRGALGPPG